MGYNRYTNLTIDGSVKRMPPIVLPRLSTDYYIVYKKGSTRLDNVSYDYYGDPSYGWLIMLANQDVASIEFEIPDGSEIRIPYPLKQSIENYEQNITKYKILYGV